MLLVPDDLDVYGNVDLVIHFVLDIFLEMHVFVVVGLLLDLIQLSKVDVWARPYHIVADLAWRAVEFLRL